MAIDIKKANLGHNPDESSVKDIELFFDASISDDFVVTCGTVHRTCSMHIVLDRKVRITI